MCWYGQAGAGVEVADGHTRAELSVAGERSPTYHQAESQSFVPGAITMKRLINVLAILAFLALAFCLPACNTTKGFGKDVGKLGDSMKNSAERNGAE